MGHVPLPRAPTVFDHYSKPHDAARTRVRIKWTKSYTGSDFWNDPHMWCDVPTTNGRLEPFWMHQHRKKPVVVESHDLKKHYIPISSNHQYPSHLCYFKNHKLAHFMSYHDAEKFVRYSGRGAIILNSEKMQYEIIYQD